LSSLTEVELSKKVGVEPTDLDPPVKKVYVKNPNSKATTSSGGNKRTYAPVDDQFEPPAKLFRASAILARNALVLFPLVRLLDGTFPSHP
jgi:hypothetical protein